MRQLDPLNYRVVCRDCGLEAPFLHASSSECVEALRLERSRLVAEFCNNAAAEAAPARNASPMSPRLALILEAPVGGALELRRR